MKDVLRRFARAKAGATAIEYALMAAILGIGVLTSATGLNGALQHLYTYLLSGYQQS